MSDLDDLVDEAEATLDALEAAVPDDSIETEADYRADGAEAEAEAYSDMRNGGER